MFNPAITMGTRKDKNLKNWLFLNWNSLSGGRTIHLVSPFQYVSFSTAVLGGKFGQLVYYASAIKFIFKMFLCFYVLFKRLLKGLFLFTKYVLAFSSFVPPCCKFVNWRIKEYPLDWTILRPAPTERRKHFIFQLTIWLVEASLLRRRFSNVKRRHK